MRCEDYPCCGHENGECPDRGDSDYDDHYDNEPCDERFDEDEDEDYDCEPPEDRHLDGMYEE